MCSPLINDYRTRRSPNFGKRMVSKSSKSEVVYFSAPNHVIGRLQPSLRYVTAGMPVEVCPYLQGIVL